MLGEEGRCVRGREVCVRGREGDVCIWVKVMCVYLGEGICCR